ncbi:MAG: pilin [Wenzhouxiangellaceae bacterium]
MTSVHEIRSAPVIRAVAVSALAVLFLAACGQRDAGPQSTPPVDQQVTWAEHVADRARLVERLPDETWAYLRVPGPWGLMAAPKNNALGPALATEANLENVAGLQTALGETLGREFPDLAPLLGPFLDELRSPIELALVGEGDQPLNADLVVEARFDFDSLEAVNARFAALAELHGMVRVIDAATEATPGQLFAGPAATFYHFNPDSQRLLLVTGMAVSSESIARAKAWPERAQVPVHELEARIDESRHGMVLWVDTQRMRPMLESSVSESALSLSRALGLLETEHLALGFGTRGGKGRMAIHARGRDGMLWDLTLPQLPPPAFDTAGQPRLVFGVTLPGYAWLVDNVLPAIAAEAPDAASTVDQASAQLEQLTGAGLERWMNVLAGRLFVIDDDNGVYLLHQPAGESQWPEFLQQVSTLAETRSAMQIGGRTIHHTTFSGKAWVEAGADQEDSNLDATTVQLLRLYARMGSHIYWTETDGMALFAEVPQVLADRLRNPAGQSLAAHLTSVGQQVESAAVFGSVRLAQAPRRNYYAWLAFLHNLADLFEYELDLTAYPSARELELPAWGDGGFSIDYSGDAIGLELTYENHPGDLMYGAGGIGMLAVAGIAAAIAVPAYQDYVARSRINLAMAMATTLKLEIETFRLDHGRWPREDEIDIPVFDDSKSVRSISYRADPPAVVIELSEEGRIELVPELDGESIAATWHCVAEDVREAWLPAECR